MTTHLLRSLVVCIGKLPLSLRRLLARALGTIAAAIPSKDRTICDLHLRKILPESKTSSGDIYRHLATVLVESFNLKPLLDDPSLIDCHELVDYWKNHDRARGIVALSAHLGNWELLAAVAVREQVPLQVIGREARKSAWHDALSLIREQYGVKVLWRADSSAIKKMVSALRSGEVIAALIDQDTEVRSIFSDFFGRPAKTPCALIEMGLRAGASFVTALTVRLTDGRYKMRVIPIPTPPDASVQSTLDEYHRVLEEQVRLYPTQWVWMHKRWRSKADGARYSSTNYIRMLEDL